MNKNKYLIALSESTRTQFGRIDFAEQEPEQRVFSAIWELESQVNNGGFEQYFFNCDADVVMFAPDALRAIGALNCADIVARALTLVAPIGGHPLDQSARLDLIDSPTGEATARLNALDSEFYAYPDNLTDLLYAYVQDHAAAFGEASAGA